VRSEGNFLIAKFREVKHALYNNVYITELTDRGKFDRWVRWEVPLEGWMVLNTEGAAKGNPGPAGAGGVLLGNAGEWIAGFSEYRRHCSSVKAELREVLRGLTLAK